MSWIPFKIGQPKKQIVPKTVERDFEREYGKLQQLEEQTKRLQKDLKKSTDADLAMSKSAVKISLDLLSNPLCEQDQDFLNMVTALDTAMKRMDAFNQEKVNQIQKTVIEPLKKFGSVFPSLNMAVKRREQALQDYRRLQAKVEKYEEKEKTGPVLAKLHQAREELRPVRDDFEAKNKQLLDEMPRFYNSRLDYFQPSFESLIRAQGYTCGIWKLPIKGVHSESQLSAYTTATATGDLSRTCDLRCSSGQRQILKPLSEARDQTCNLMGTSQAYHHPGVGSRVLLGNAQDLWRPDPAARPAWPH
ncbi:bridging integrator 3 isoform X3 [Sus scrofa]|uniref:bridging integrator 3 isoform X3 n=1 Tax=Sus scrofa TaxID=9823 RepID=UPI000A2B9523|nr:bridging integrator 3 isoform X3 [Sus scrofa]